MPWERKPTDKAVDRALAKLAEQGRAIQDTRGLVACTVTLTAEAEPTSALWLGNAKPSSLMSPYVAVQRC